MEHDRDPWDRPSARSRWWARVHAETIGRWRPWVAWFGAARLAGAALTVLVALGLAWWLFRPSPPPVESTLPYASTPSTSSAVAPTTTPTGPPPTTGPTGVVVHVAGAVVAPGVYALAPGSRVVDGVTVAGGGAPDADLSALNLAAALVDGERIYVPRVGEAPVPAAVPGPFGSSPPSGPVDLNAAGVDELDTLPGIGPTTAAAIVAFRDEHGPFASVAALEDVPGIGPAKLATLEGLVTT